MSRWRSKYSILHRFRNSRATPRVGLSTADLPRPDPLTGSIDAEHPNTPAPTFPISTPSDDLLRHGGCGRADGLGKKISISG